MNNQSLYAACAAIALYVLITWALSLFVTVPWYVLTAIAFLVGGLAGRWASGAKRHRVLPDEHRARMDRIRKKLDREE